MRSPTSWRTTIPNAIIRASQTNSCARPYRRTISVGASAPTARRNAQLLSPRRCLTARFSLSGQNGVRRVRTWMTAIRKVNTTDRHPCSCFANSLASRLLPTRRRPLMTTKLAVRSRVSSLSFASSVSLPTKWATLIRFGEVAGKRNLTSPNRHLPFWRDTANPHPSPSGRPPHARGAALQPRRRPVVRDGVLDRSRPRLCENALQRRWVTIAASGF